MEFLRTTGAASVVDMERIFSGLEPLHDIKIVFQYDRKTPFRIGVEALGGIKAFGETSE